MVCALGKTTDFLPAYPEQGDDELRRVGCLKFLACSIHQR